MQATLDTPRTGAVFLDRDGVINVNRADHVKTWEEFEFLPGAIDAIVDLSRAAWPCSWSRTRRS